MCPRLRVFTFAAAGGSMENSTRCVLFHPSPCVKCQLSWSVDHLFWGPVLRRGAAGRQLGGGSRHPQRAVWGPKTRLGNIKEMAPGAVPVPKLFRYRNSFAPRSCFGPRGCFGTETVSVPKQFRTPELFRPPELFRYRNCFGTETVSHPPGGRWQTAGHARRPHVFVRGLSRNFTIPG